MNMVVTSQMVVNAKHLFLNLCVTNIELFLKETQHLGSPSERKTGLCGKNSQEADPIPPVWETPVIKKKVGFIFSCPEQLNR